MMRRYLHAFALIFSLLFLFTSCNMEADPEEESWDSDFPPAASDSEEDEDSSALHITEFSLPYLSSQTLDPINCIDGVQQNVSALLYEGLFVLDEHFDAHNVLCESYQYDTEALRYTFFLREGITFSDGSSFTAQDVLATYRRAMASERYSARFKDVASIRASDTHTLVITLNNGNSAFPSLLDIPIVKSGSEEDLVPLGTGPYLFVSDSTGASLLSNTAWWQHKKLPLSRISLFPSKDNDTAMHLFSSYDVHFLRADPTGAATIPSVGEISFTDFPTPTMQFLGFNMSDSLLSQPEVRAAMNCVIERDGLVSAYLSGHGTAAQFPISPSSALYPDVLEETLSPADYAALLAEQGIEAEHPRTLTLLVNEENSFKNSLADALCEQLSSPGLSVVKKALPWTEYLSSLQKGDFDLYYGEIRLTADWDISALVKSGGSLNYGAYADETMDLLLAEFLLAQNEETAHTLYRYFLQNAPILPIAFKTNSILSPSELIHNLTPTFSCSFYGLENWSFSLWEDES